MANGWNRDRGNNERGDWRGDQNDQDFGRYAHEGWNRGDMGPDNRWMRDNQGQQMQGGFNRGSYEQGRPSQNESQANYGYHYDQGQYTQGGYNQGGYDQGGYDQGGYDQGRTPGRMGGYDRANRGGMNRSMQGQQGGQGRDFQGGYGGGYDRNMGGGYDREDEYRRNAGARPEWDRGPEQYGRGSMGMQDRGMDYGGGMNRGPGFGRQNTSTTGLSGGMGGGRGYGNNPIYDRDSQFGRSRQHDGSWTGSTPGAFGQQDEGSVGWRGFEGANFEGGTFENRDRPRHSRGPRNYSRSDERIREDLCDRLMRDWDLDVSDVSVDVDNGQVKLSGTVRDRRTKHRIEDMASEIMGAKDVENRLRVEGLRGRNLEQDRDFNRGETSAQGSRGQSLGTQASTQTSTQTRGADTGRKGKTDKTRNSENGQTGSSRSSGSGTADA